MKLVGTCVHCGELQPIDAQGHISYHSWPRPTRQVCAGSKRASREDGVRLIFLDFDGVVNSPGSWTMERATVTRLHIPHEAACIERLNAIVARSNAKIVVSSSWRMIVSYAILAPALLELAGQDVPKGTSYQHLGPALVRHGLIGDVIGETPRTEVARELLLEHGYDLDDALPRRYERGMDIWAWLLTHQLTRRVDEIVIIDDSDDMWRLAPCLVHTNGAWGLRDEDVDFAMEVFKESRTYVEAIYADRARLGL